MLISSIVGINSRTTMDMDATREEVIEKGFVARIGEQDSCIVRSFDGKEITRLCSISSHKEGFELIFQVLTDPEVGTLKDLSEIYAVGHRIAHGGTQFSQSVLVTDEVIQQIKQYTPLAPLHNPMNLLGIDIVEHILPKAKQVAVFDTCFHHTLPLKVRVFPIPYRFFEEDGIQSCGFHSQSYRYVIPRAAKLVNRPIEDLKMIICHLGNGCTITAIDGGKSIDTSLGFSTYVGAMMGTRPGDFDPALIFFLNQEYGMSLDEIQNMLYKESGLLGVSGVSSDMREVLKQASLGNERCQLAVDMFTYKVKKFIGSFTAALGGLDALVFTAGIGENSPEVRERSCEGLEFLGISLDKELNSKTRGKEVVISNTDSKVKVLVVPTNEEQIIIEDTIRISGFGRILTDSIPVNSSSENTSVNSLKSHLQ